ncbi:MAG: hypothetical protein AAB038_00370 [Planctomycetota bacterium]
MRSNLLSFVRTEYGKIGKQRIICSGMAALLSLGIMLPSVLTATPTAPANPAQTKDNVKTKAETKNEEARKKDEIIQKKMLNDGFDKTMKSKGYRFKGVRMIGFVMAEPFKLETPFRGVTKNPNKSAKEITAPLTYMTCETAGVNGAAQKHELYQLGDRKHAKNLPTGKPVDPNDSTARTPTPLDLIAPVIETLENHKRAPEETINGMECFVIEAVMEKTGADHIVSQQQTLKGFMPPAGSRIYKTAAFKVWLDKQEKIVRQIEVDIDYSTQAGSTSSPGAKMPTITSRQVQMKVSFLDYDQNIQIEVPDAVKKEIGLRSGQKD